MLTSCSARRKQGGSQSVNDNAKGAAISAGAMLRRYGEQALRDVCSTLFTSHPRRLPPVFRISVICYESGPTRLTNANECGSGRAFRIGEYSSIMRIPSWSRGMKDYGRSLSRLAVQ